MQIRGHDGALNRTVEAVAQPISGALDYRCKRQGIRTQNRSATVVFESGQWLRQAVDHRCGHHLADRSLRLRGGGHIQQAHALDPLTRRSFVPVPKHLDRRTDRQHRRTAGHGTLQALVLKQMFRGQPLRVVLGTAEGVEVQLIRHRIGQGDLDDLGGDPA